MGDMKMDLVMVSSEKPKVSSKELIEMTAELEETSLSAANGKKLVSNCPQSIVLVQKLRPLAMDSMLGPKGTWSLHRGVSASVLPVAGQDADSSPLETSDAQEHEFAGCIRCDVDLTAAACDRVLQFAGESVVAQQDDALGFHSKDLNAESLLHNETKDVPTASPHFLADLK